MKEIIDKLYNKLKYLGIVDSDTRSYNVGKSDYSKHTIQPYSIWLDWNLNPWDADIVKRVLRTKEGEDRTTDYEKIIHICQERIRQLKFEKEIVLETNEDLDMNKIRKGDKFECIQDVVMDDGEVLYRNGKAYASQIDGCITDEQHDERHEWGIFDEEEHNWWHYFKRV